MESTFDVSIRDFRPADLSRILDISVSAWAPIFASFQNILKDDLFKMLFQDWRTEKIEQVKGARLGKHGAKVLVAELSGTVVGFVSYYCSNRTHMGEIGNNAVDPLYQGKGIGPTMYGVVLDKMRQEDMRFVKVSTGGDPSHAAARRAYEKVGFSVALPGLDYFRTL